MRFKRLPFCKIIYAFYRLILALQLIRLKIYSAYDIIINKRDISESLVCRFMFANIR